MCENCNGHQYKIEIPDIITVPGLDSDSPEQEAFERKQRERLDRSGRYGLTPTPIVR